MKERPILMTPDNAGKVFEGAKTQTRRIVKYSPILGEPDYWCSKIGESYFVRVMGDYRRFCNYGQVGGRLWIREAYARSGCLDNCAHLGCHTLYKGSSKKSLGAYGAVKWKSSIHMPRWACRTVVDLTDVLVERVQDITEDNAKAEGAAFVCEQCGSDLDTQEGSEVHAACDDLDCNQGSYREGFRRLWNSINGTGSWERNDWVWVLTMRRVTP